jgi:periplasmic divalent cation tolerance protein
MDVAHPPPAATAALRVVVTTVPRRELALALARAAVEHRLAACAQVDDRPITSVYRWDGALCEDTEWRLTFKTRADCEAALQALVQAQHPYAVPQWVVLPAQAEAAYGRWVWSETGGADLPPG